MSAKSSLTPAVKYRRVVLKLSGEVLAGVELRGRGGKVDTLVSVDVDDVPLLRLAGDRPGASH